MPGWFYGRFKRVGIEPGTARKVERLMMMTSKARISRAFGGRQCGFTLMEIILVMVIILTLVGLVGPKLAGKAGKAKKDATKIQMGLIKTALTNFEINAARFPTTSEGLEALVSRPSDLAEDEWPHMYMERLPLDSFHQPFNYVQPSEHGLDYDLISSGRDKRFGTEDDITNYSDEDSDNL
jgi:general secretion pathway protein G